MDKTAIDRRHKLQEEKDKIVSQMIVDGLKVRAGECSMYSLCVIFFQCLCCKFFLKNVNQGSDCPRSNNKIKCC